MNAWRSIRPVLYFMVGVAALMTAGCGAPVAVAGISYAADGTLLATSSKTASDHLISMVSKRDCAVWRAFQGHPICKEREGDKDPYDVDYTHAERTVAEDGVHYAPPLRPVANAPATSWDAAVYDQAAPSPQVKPAVASSTAPATPAPITKVPPARKTKSAQRTKAKKPSQDPAASGS
jgi:hypothetical protein